MCGTKIPMKGQLLSTLPPLKLADANNDRVQRFSAKGKFQLNWGQKGSNNGQFWTPVGICVDGDRDEVDNDK